MEWKRRTGFKLKRKFNIVSLCSILESENNRNYKRSKKRRSEEINKSGHLILSDL